MIGFRLAAGVLLLPAAIMFTWLTIDGLSARRRLRTELAEISHVRYGLLNADRWMEKILPILDANIDRLDMKAASRASLRPTVVKALYRLLDDVKEKMSAKNSQSTGLGGFLGQGNALMVNLMVGALRPHVPEYADMVLAELGKPESKEAFKRYIRSVLAEGAKNTFGNVDMRWYSSILKQYGCADATACQQELGNRIRVAEAKLEYCCLAVLLSSALAFVLLLTGRPVLRRSATIVLLLFCVVLLVGGVLSPMIEVEAKISRLGMTFLGRADRVWGPGGLFSEQDCARSVSHADHAGPAGYVDRRGIGADVQRRLSNLEDLCRIRLFVQSVVASGESSGEISCPGVVEMVDGRCDGPGHIHGVCRL